MCVAGERFAEESEDVLYESTDDGNDDNRGAFVAFVIDYFLQL